ncbi:hypothetical protein ACFQJC_07225 [Haloferax namakaokahaiae]|uniref:Uncharacterized protein n=1 Tax=Haloferax namakaokahaiae TaxID=1748331 RepID=A0ABD5ZDD1_9EURY
MVGTTLIQIRTHIETLADEDGPYCLVCGRTGERPVPVAGLRFADRPTAQRAAGAAEQYRTALRRYDPQLPYYDLIVCEDSETRPTRESAVTDPSATDGGASASRRDPDTEATSRTQWRIEFCHNVAAAVFESLCDAGHRVVETAVMDRYFDLAETVTDPDDLCLRLLESTAMELETHLTPEEQADVLAGAAARLSPPADSDVPIEAILVQLRKLGVVGSYRYLPLPATVKADSHTVRFELSEYALSPKDGRIPVLPVVLDLYRRQAVWAPTDCHVERDDDRWLVTLTFSKDEPPVGVASVAIHSGGSR